MTKSEMRAIDTCPTPLMYVEIEVMSAYKAKLFDASPSLRTEYALYANVMSDMRTYERKMSI